MQDKLNKKGIIPYLIIQNAYQAIKFYKQIFRVEEKNILLMPDGKIAYAELLIEEIPIMLSDEMAEMGVFGPKKTGSNPISLYVYVKNIDEIFNKAINLGARVLKPVRDQFWGDRMGTFEDPFGHVWSLAMPYEEVTDQEVKNRYQKMCNA